MLTRHLCCLVAAIIPLVCGGVSQAQEDVPGGESARSSGNVYDDLRDSDDRVTQLMAERYHNLVKLQEWSDLTGKFTTSARYVGHDPDMKWVKLASVKGSGKTRVVKEVTVPVAKLSKTCQSRVRQIALIQTKLDVLGAAEPAAGEAGTPPFADSGAPMTDERGVEPGREFGNVAEVVADAVERTPREAARINVPASPPAGRNDPDPLGFGELPADPAPIGAPFNVVQPAGAPRNQAAPAAPAPPAVQVDQSNWQTSYDAFRANFTITQDERGQPQINWGELQSLQQIGAAAANAPAGEQANADGSASADQLGEVRWEATFQGMRPADPYVLILLDAQPLPPPLQIEFRLEQRDRATAAEWPQFSRGDRVSFTGRLAMVGPTSIAVYVREPQLVRAAPKPQR